MISNETRAAVQRAHKRTLVSGTFTVLTLTQTDGDFGTDETWAESATQFMGRLTKERSDAKVVLDVAKNRDRYVLTTPSVIVLAIGDRVRKGAQDFTVTGVEHGEDYGERVASAYMVAKV